MTGIDPVTRKVTVLFNPRTQQWQRHFQWREFTIVGKTAVGRATVAVLAMNHPDRMAIRRALQQVGSFPFGEA